MKNESIRILDKVLVTRRVFGITGGMGTERKQGKVTGMTPTKMKIRYNIFRAEWIGNECVERIIYRK
jgi:hypothetical protein